MNSLCSTSEPKSFLEMSWDEVQDALRETDVIIVPIGQTAQHGPHLPVMADVLQVCEIARRVVVKLAEDGHKAVLGPFIPYGHSPGHYEFPGYVSLEPETLTSLVRDVCASLVQQGFRRIVILNTGGGNWGALHSALYHLWKEGGAQVYLLGTLFVWKPGEGIVECEHPELGEYDGHAGELETSNLLAIAPNLVQMKKAKRYMSRTKAELAGLPFIRFNWNERAMAVGISSWKAFSESGASGDPTIATAEKGNRILGQVAEVLSDHIEKYCFNKQ